MKEIYRTTDLPLSAFLLTQKIQFLGMERKDQRALWFTFTPLGKCEELANDFFSGRGKVAPRDYSDALRRARDLVFERDRQEAGIR